MTFARIRALAIVGALVVAALVLVLTAITKDRQTGDRAAEGCPEGAVVADLSLPVEEKIKINVYNATDQVGLATGVADELRGRRFVVGEVGNDPEGKRVDEVAVLRYGPKQVGAAWVLRAHFLNEATLEFDIQRTDDVIDIVLGTQYKQLATQTEKNQALAQVGAPQLPTGTCDGTRR